MNVIIYLEVPQPTADTINQTNFFPILYELDVLMRCTFDILILKFERVHELFRL